MSPHRSLIVMAVGAACLAAAPAASADDASVFGAYTARQASEVDPAGKAYLRAARQARRTGTRRAYRAVIRADRAINAVLTQIEADLSAQAASSEPGTAARTAALAEVRGWRRANDDEIRAVRALVRGDRPTANRWLRRATRKMRRTFRHGKTAVGQFTAVGLSSPVGAISGS
jgi:Ni/Co efflux regulator RcnB